MNHPDVLQAAATLKDLAEKVAKSLDTHCNIVLECHENEDPEVIINEWVVIRTFIIDTVKCVNPFLPVKKIQYAISHVVNYPSWNRDEPDDVDEVDDITVDSPWKAIKEAFDMIKENELNNIINSVQENEMIKEQHLAEEEMQKENQRKVKDFNTLFDGL